MTETQEPLVTRQIALEEFGEQIVDLAMSFYETLYDKCFWTDLDDETQLGYLHRAKYAHQRETQRLREMASINSCWRE